MRFMVLVVPSVLASSHAQVLQGMQSATPAQQQVINRNAVAFTGRLCVAYGAKLMAVPPGITQAQRQQVMTYAVNEVLRAYQQMGVKVTRFSWQTDGGAAIYLSGDGSYMQFTSVFSGGRWYSGTFGCVLKP